MLRQWLDESPFEGSPKLLAKHLDVPLSTVKGWLYEGKEPNVPQRWQLYALTGLDIYKPSGNVERAALARVRAELEEQAGERAQLLEIATEQVWTHLEYFVLCPREHRELLHQRVGRDELEAIGRMFRLLADPQKFSAWRTLRGLRRRIGSAHD